MNIHVTEELKSKWPQYEFIGTPFTLSNGKTYMRAKHKVWWDGRVHIYSFEDDWFWHDTPTSELINLKVNK